MIQDILEAKLTATGLFTPGLNLFRGTMPGHIEVGVFTREPLTGIPVDAAMPNYYRGTMQVITRHTDPIQGRALAIKAQNALKVMRLETYPASAERGRAHLTLFWPKTLPVRFPRLEGNGYEWSQHFDAVFGFEES